MFNHVERVDRVELLHVSTRLIILGKRTLQMPLLPYMIPLTATRPINLSIHLRED